MSDASTLLLESWEREVLDSTWVRFAPGGDGHCTAIVNAVFGNYNRLAARPRPTPEDLQKRLGERVTLIVRVKNDFGGVMIKAWEGKLFGDGQGGAALLPKGRRKNGWRVRTEDLLDLIPGYNTLTAENLVVGVRSHYPTLTKITTERLCELPEWNGEDSALITLCAFGTWQMPDSTATDAIQLIATYDRENDICNGGVLLIRPQFGYSEHGSCYGSQIIGSFGEVVGFEPISFEMALELTDLDFDDAYARVVPTA